MAAPLTPVIAPRLTSAAALAVAYRTRWPRTREWHFLCATCEDIGLDIRQCPDTPCGRDQPHAPHSYGVVCTCRASARWRSPAAEPENLVRRASQARPIRRVP